MARLPRGPVTIIDDPAVLAALDAKGFSFTGVFGGAVNRGNRPACSADHFCREDFMCQSLPTDTPGAAKVKGIGFCSPSYFIFQMRIDNHATPWASAARDPWGRGSGRQERNRT